MQRLLSQRAAAVPLRYFDPAGEGMGGDRSWWWWDAGTSGPGTGWVEAATTGWPFGSGSLLWLIRASRGAGIDYDQA
jgi:hypothetical protein